MIRTISGALSVGSPNSAARFAEEARHAIENQYQLLFLTDEGNEMLTRFANSLGCDYSLMTREEASNWINSEHKALFSFLSAVTFLQNKI